MKIEIRNMVCRNCVRALERMLDEQGLNAIAVGLGFAEIGEGDLSGEQLARLDEGLARLGFERIVSSGERIAEAVKLEVIRHINSDEPCSMNLSHCIENALGQDYKTVSRIFSAVEGRTIEKYYITARIEKAKELLSYGDITLTEIAYRLGYSSVAFLSRQFKQETGMTPTQYQKGCRDRRFLTDL